VLTITRRGGDGGGFCVTWTDGRSAQTTDAHAVVVATPAAEAARLAGGLEEGIADALCEIEYAGVAQVSTGYRQSDVHIRLDNEPLRGFGFLVPRAEGLRILGTVFNSYLFPGRAPEAPQPMVLFTTFLGGATDPGICDLPLDSIVEIARREVAGVLNIKGAPVAEYVSVWKRGLPQYNLGHGRIVSRLNQACAAVPGLRITGNYLAGPSLGSCVKHANGVADALMSSPGSKHEL
jgi:oxygen-dependent protoporphyrinogen oxidase